MPQFLVEAYQERLEPLPPIEGVVLVSSMFVPEDEVCLHVLDAPSADVLRAALDLAAFHYDRIAFVRDPRSEEER